MKPKVGFSIREEKYTGEIHVIARVTVNGLKTSFRTGHKIRTKKHWKRGMVSGSHPYLMEIYIALTKMKEEIEAIECSPGHTPLMVKQMYKGEYNKQMSDYPFSLLSAIRYTIKAKEMDATIAQATTDNYWSVFNVVTMWLDDKKWEDIPLNQLRKQHMREFADWVLSRNGTGRQSTIHHHYAIINICINYVIEEFIDDGAMIKFNPIKGAVKRPDKHKKRMESHENHLTEDQIQQVEDMRIDDYLKGKGSLPIIPSEWYRLTVLFQVYSGFSFVDMGHDKWDISKNIKGQELITLYRGKNAQECHIPVSPDLRRIINELEKISKEHNHNRLFPFQPFVNPEDHTDKDKTLYNREYANYRNFIKKLGDKLEPVFNFSSHTLRHTFAMIMLNRYGISWESLAAMMGHTKVATTQESYGYIKKERVSDEFFDKLNKVS